MITNEVKSPQEKESLNLNVNNNSGSVIGGDITKKIGGAKVSDFTSTLPQVRSHSAKPKKSQS